MLTAAEPEPEPSKRAPTPRSWVGRLSSVFGGGGGDDGPAVEEGDGAKHAWGLPDAEPEGGRLERSSRAQHRPPRVGSPVRRRPESPRTVAADVDVEAADHAPAHDDSDASLADEELSDPSTSDDPPQTLPPSLRRRAPRAPTPRRRQPPSPRGPPRGALRRRRILADLGGSRRALAHPQRRLVVAVVVGLAAAPRLAAQPGLDVVVGVADARRGAGAAGRGAG
ncbi:Uncharacterized protein TPAR_07541 [Tolypocladium paradoxum]|uniref:Uncharacterized protein n=1 Tax=Tolypocladium paradoxum TaxID=94208 RepID=A0A2S4KPZ1_9HYPO|nr:Uncharacterized protein TPAR_07541 [Tolypocladium paradoxum]